MNTIEPSPLRPVSLLHPLVLLLSRLSRLRGLDGRRYFHAVLLQAPRAAAATGGQSSFRKVDSSCAKVAFLRLKRGQKRRGSEIADDGDSWSLASVVVVNLRTSQIFSSYGAHPSQLDGKTETLCLIRHDGGERWEPSISTLGLNDHSIFDHVVSSLPSTGSCQHQLQLPHPSGVVPRPLRSPSTGPPLAQLSLWRRKGLKDAAGWPQGVGKACSRQRGNVDGSSLTTVQWTMYEPAQPSSPITRDRGHDPPAVGPRIPGLESSSACMASLPNKCWSQQPEDCLSEAAGTVWDVSLARQIRRGGR